MNQLPPPFFIRSSTSTRELLVGVQMSVVCYQSSQFWPAVINGGKSNHPFPSFYFVVVFAVVVVVVVEMGTGVSCGLFFFLLLFFS